MAEPNDPAELIGRVVADKYRVVSLLGLGSMGAVYEVERVGDGVRLALKVLRPELCDNDDIVARFQREGKTLGLLRHRNIVELVDVGRLPNGPFYLATELVRGVSLRSVIDDGHVEPRRALSIMRQVLDALGHAHGVGVVHRDVKPENIMLVDGGAPGEDTDLIKMFDFGIAKLLADTLALLGDAKLTQTGITLLGTPMYMPPETVLGTSIDARGDLYSVGVILFELLAGNPPFTAVNAAALMELHAASPVPTLASAAPDHKFTPQEEHLVAEALAKKPEHRFASAAEMTAALDAAVHSLDEPPAPVTKPGAHDTMMSLVPPAPSRPMSSIALDPEGATPIADFRAAYPAPPPRPPRIDRRRQFAIGGGVVALALVLIIALKAGGSSHAVSSDLAKRATDRLAVSDPLGAIELVERELASPGASANADVYVALGHARIAVGRRLDALAAYERAITLDRARAADAQIRSNVTKILDGSDAAASIVALDILANRVEPPARDAIVALASNGKLPEARHRAFALAEQLGIDSGIDRIESWSMDLKQSTTCDERRTAVIKLRAIGDRRALPALRKARTQYPCIDHDLADAIGFLEAQK